MSVARKDCYQVQYHEHNKLKIVNSLLYSLFSKFHVGRRLSRQTCAWWMLQPEYKRSNMQAHRIETLARSDTFFGHGGVLRVRGSLADLRFAPRTCPC